MKTLIRILLATLMLVATTSTIAVADGDPAPCVPGTPHCVPPPPMVGR